TYFGRKTARMATGSEKTPPKEQRGRYHESAALFSIFARISSGTHTTKKPPQKAERLSYIAEDST
ncbi:MAG: hypothetical protein IIX12_04220, partial [Alistipes sp.]|nr:hypothetical protein [Alistipes sp.]